MKRFGIIVYVLMLSCIFMTAESAWSFEVTEMVFTNEAYDCKKPVSKTSFTDNDLGVTAWIYYLDYEDGKTWKSEWQSPNNTIALSQSNSRGSTSGGCSYRSMSRDTLRDYGTGQWTVRFYYDGQLAKTATFDYTMTHANIWKSDKIYAIPDYMQTDPAYGGFPEGGSNYCAPTSVSDSLMWLANNGFENLASNTTDRKKDQYDLIANLASNYMGTDPTEGTNVKEVLTGVRNYLSDKGYKDSQLKYQGWRESLPEAATEIEVPDMGWIRSGIEGTGSVWLNLGWYTYDSGKDEYNRVGGHWVTLVGYGYDGNPDYLVIHDPNTAYTNHFVLPVRITSGTLTGSTRGLPRSAVGLYKMNNGMRISSKGDFGILDGVVVLSMNPLSSVSVGKLGNDLKLNLSCAQFQGNQYQFALAYSPTPTDPLVWKPDINSFKPITNSTTACLAVGNDLKLNLSAEYGGVAYSFSMNYAADPNDPLAWKLDANTLKAK